MNAATGNKLWNYSPSNLPVASSPAVVGGVVFIGSEDDNVYALNANTGAKLWNYTTDYMVDSSPAVVDGVVYVGTDAGSVYALGGSLTQSSSPTPTPIATPTPTPTSTAAPPPGTTAQATTLPATTENGAIVDLTFSGNVTIGQMSNVTIATNQSAITTVSFTVTGESGTTGFSNVTIPKSAVTYGTTPAIYIDGLPASNQGYTQDANNYYVWYTTNFSTHEVSIVFTTTSPSPNSTSQSSLPKEAIYGVAVAVASVAIVAVVLMLRKRGKGKS